MESVPCVSLITVDDNTFVIVRQTLAGGTSELVMNIAQYSGLMFVLKSMEKQLMADEMQKRANTLLATATIQDNHFESNVDVASDRTRAVAFNDFDIENCYDPNKPEMGIECEPLEKKPRVEKPVKTKAISTTRVRDELVDIYAMLFCELYAEKLAEKCNGCLFGKFTAAEHNVCKVMKKRDRIELVFNDVMVDIPENAVRQKLAEREGDQIYIDKNILMNDVNWTRKLKLKLEKYI